MPRLAVLGITDLGITVLGVIVLRYCFKSGVN